MRLLLISALVAATGCSVAVDDGEGGDVAAVGNVTPNGVESTVHAVIAVERTASLVSGASEDSSQVSARFLRVTGALDLEAAKRLVGAGRHRDGEASGCRWLEKSASPVADEGNIELLDVGDIVVSAEREGAAKASVALAARAFPDVGDLVSGVIYTSRDSSVGLPEAASYLIEASGSNAIERFSVRLDAPGFLERVALGSRAQGGFAATEFVLGDAGPLEDAAVGGSAAVVAITAGLPLELSWDAGATAQGDQMRLVASPRPGADGRTLLCVFDDAGSAVVPQAYMAFPAGAELDIVLHRQRRVAVDMGAPLHDAVVDFDFAVVARALVIDAR